MSWDIGIEVNGFKLESMEWNYTHNCNRMMRAAGYDWIYNLGGVKVSDSLPKFETMLANMKQDPQLYKAMNPVNNWGSYEGLLDIWEHNIMPKVRDVAEKLPEAVWWESS